MRKGKLILQIILTILLLTPLAQAATVHGIVYDIFLDELDKAIVTIDTEPQQTTVSKNGEYAFNIPQGEYIIKATHTSEDGIYKTEDPIKIIDEGEYVIDLILIPTFEDDIFNENITEIPDFDDLEKESRFSTFGIILVILAFIAIILYFHFSKSHFIKESKESEIKSETEEELEKIIKFIKTKGGRVTQKEIRKEFPSSEAKISLIITELESKNIVKKIKKGRGNVIILIKK
jgi:uncharacterized membrane protein